MSTADWRKCNSDYLAASLKWLRLRLAELAPPPAAPAPPVVELHPPRRRFFRRLFFAHQPCAAPPLLLGTSAPPLTHQVKEALAHRHAVAPCASPPALLLLAERFGLTDFERDTVLLCAGMEFDPSLAGLCSRVQGHQGRDYPTFALALMLFPEDPNWDALSAHRPLRYARLLEVNQPPGVPLTSSPLRADERIVNFLKGLNVLDDRLAAVVQPMDAGEAVLLAPSQETAAQGILDRLAQSVGASAIPVVQLIGEDAGSRLAVASRVSAELGRQLYRLRLEALPTGAGEIETLACLWQRESALLAVALYIEHDGPESAPADALSAIPRLLSREVGLVFVGVRETPLRLSCATFSAEVRRPSSTEQCDAWQEFLDVRDPGEPDTAATAQQLAAQFDLNLHSIRESAARASEETLTGAPLLEVLWDACREVTRPRLDQLAQRLEAKATWADLVLPAEALQLLRNLAGQVRARHQIFEQWGFGARMNRGLGISALFAGESGTGKTMAAEVLANELRLNLYRIDLSAVVSKYIGETEKNLRRLFDAAEQGGAILFFDEADALFGKRSEVKDSHDRYANIEINYLLQRIESFSGLAILATNMKSALDPAFVRRLRFIVQFPFPSAKERAEIWRQALPPQTPRGDLSFDRLARLTLTGGNIHSIALNAAFLAAQRREPAVTMPILLEAARMELRKLEKPFHEAEFR